MSSAFRTFFLVLLFALITSMQYNMDSDSTATRQLRNAMEIGVHDASLALDESQLANGYIVFDQVQATAHFKKALETQLKLSPDLKPLPNTYYQHPFKIKQLLFFDDKTPDPNNPGKTITFPYVYQNAQYNVLEVLDGPSVLAVVQTTSPRYFNGRGQLIRQASVYEYKIN